MDGRIVEKRKEVESFLVFLKTNNSLELYVSNMKKQRGNNWHTFFNRHNIIFFTESVFLWSITPEGGTYWNLLHAKWCNEKIK